MKVNIGSDELHTVVLHVVESFATGVAAAVLDYVRNTPEIEHHLLCQLREGSVALDPGWESAFSSVVYLPGGHVANVVRTRRVIHELRPDVVHSQSSYGGAYARLAVRSGDALRHVYTPHAWSFQRRDKSAPARLAFWAAEGVLATNTDVLAGCSRAETKAAHWGPIRPRTVYLPNTTPVIPNNRDTRSHDGQLMVAMIGRIAAQKDPLFFIACVLALRRAGHDIHPLWIGGGDERLGRSLQQHGVEVTGWVDHAGAIEQLRRADVFLYTAQYDGFPIVILEAASLGLPVIARGSPALQDTGLPLLFDTPGDLKQMWPELTDHDARAQFASWTRAALWENHADVQRRRLREAYGLHSTTPQ